MPAGRPKGSSNSKSIALKTMVLNALDRVGGEEYLQKQAMENPTAFMTLIGKLIPIDVDVTKKQINVVIGVYPEEQNDRHKLNAAQEAAPGVHQLSH